MYPVGGNDPATGSRHRKPVEKPAEMQPYKAHGTPDREADHKDQGPQQCDPETPLRNTGNRSPTRVETIKDTRSQRDRLGPESGITQSNTRATP